MSDLCTNARPNWTGEVVSAWQEMIWLFASPAALILLIGTAFALRYKSQWGGLAVMVLWGMLGSYLSFPDYNPLRAQGQLDGCFGSPTLFLAVVTAICVATILYTAPFSWRETEGKD